MKWSDFYRVEPIENDEIAGGIVGWAVVSKIDSKDHSEPGVLPYGYSSYRNAIERAKSLCNKLYDEVDGVLLND